MNKKISLFLFTLPILLFLITSCGSKRTFEIQPPIQRLAAYPLLEIPDFKSNVPQTPDQLTWKLPNEIENKLVDKELFVGISRSPVDISEDVLVLQGTITEIYPLEWYKQIVKSVTIEINVKFIEKNSGNIVAEANFEGKAKWGILGGTRVFADIRVVDEIVAYIERKYK